MNMQNNETLATRSGFILPQVMNSDFTAEELAEDMDGLRLSFKQVKIPAGGALQFEVPSNDPDNPDYTKTLEGVILYNHFSYAYWPENDDGDPDENATPLCQSVDGKVGYGIRSSRRCGNVCKRPCLRSCGKRCLRAVGKPTAFPSGRE